MPPVKPTPFRLGSLMLLGTTLVNAAIQQYEWCIDQISAEFDGVTRWIYGVNGRPGIEAPIIGDVGDEVRVYVFNNLTEPTCIHWHGIPQYGTPEQDGASGVTQCRIEPGQSAHYRFFLPEAGTFWWHSHEGTQVVDGLRGPIIVHEKSEAQHQHEIERSVDEEYTVMLSDWYHEQSAVLLREMMDPVKNPSGNEPVWETVIINDRGRFNCSQLGGNLSSLPCSDVQPLSTFRFYAGKRYRLRLINVAAFAAFDFSIDNHVFRVVSADGQPVAITRPINSVRINVAQRYDIIVDAIPQSSTQDGQGDQSSRSRNYWMRATSLYGPPWTSLPLSQFPSGFNPHGLAIIQYTYDNLSDPTTTPWATVDTVSEMEFRSRTPISLPSQPAQRVTVPFTMTSTSSNPVTLGYLSIDGRPFETFVMPMMPTLFEVARGVPVSDLPATSNIASIPLASHVEIVLINLDPGEHPFHMHGEPVWVVGAGNMASVNATPSNLILKNPVKRDTYTVPGCTPNATTGACVDVGYLVLRHETNNPGVWMMHCHIEWHLATGLAMLFVEGADTLAKRGLDPYLSMVYETCGTMY